MPDRRAHAQTRSLDEGGKAAGRDTGPILAQKVLANHRRCSHGPTASFCVCQRGSQFSRSVVHADATHFRVFGCGASMRIKLTSIMVDNQEKALRFYTEVWASRRSMNSVGEYRWITVVSTEGPGDVELALEPNANPAGKTSSCNLFRGTLTDTNTGNWRSLQRFKRYAGDAAAWIVLAAILKPQKHSIRCGRWPRGHRDS